MHPLWACPAQVRERRSARDPEAQLRGGDTQAPDSALIGWVTEPGGARRVCPRCYGRGFIRTAEVRAALAGAKVTITRRRVSC